MDSRMVVSADLSLDILRLWHSIMRSLYERFARGIAEDKIIQEGDRGENGQNRRGFGRREKQTKTADIKRPRTRLSSVPRHICARIMVNMWVIKLLGDGALITANCMLWARRNGEILSRTEDKRVDYSGIVCDACEREWGRSSVSISRACVSRFQDGVIERARIHVYVCVCVCVGTYICMWRKFRFFFVDAHRRWAERLNFAFCTRE